MELDDAVHRMEQSPTIGALALALSKAQGQMRPAPKGSANPFFRSSYADLPACWEAARKALTENELAVIQTTEPNPDAVVIVTTLVHSSGEWIKGKLSLKPVKNDPQGMGSAITYGRRYALSAIVGITAEEEDDDGNAASGQNGRQEGRRKAQEASKAVVEQAIQELKAAARKGWQPLYETFKGLPAEVREAPAVLACKDEMKTVAQEVDKKREAAHA